MQNQVADASLLTSDVNNPEQYKDDDLLILQMSKYDFGMLARVHEYTAWLGLYLCLSNFKTYMPFPFVHVMEQKGL